MSEISSSPDHNRVLSLIETIQQHPTQLLQAERRLMATKWFDYRFLSPKEANRLFTRTYQEVYRRKFAENIDREMARKVNGINFSKMKTDARERSQLVIARQRADEFGMSYPVYIEAAFDFAMRRGNKRKALPRPSQLHGNGKAAPAFVEYIMKRWEELLLDGLVRVEHPAYLIENYRGMPAQDDFRRFVLDHVKQTSMPLERAIRTFAYEKKQVPADLFRSIRSEDMFKRAMESVESDLRDEIASVPLTSSQLWPTCFGMNYTHHPSSLECSACPQASNCKKIGDFVLRKAAMQVGVSDPAEDYHRRMGRKRKQKQRLQDRERKAKGAGRIGTPPDTSIPSHA